jgi:CheY-like chemotaxis protein
MAMTKFQWSTLGVLVVARDGLTCASLRSVLGRMGTKEVRVAARAADGLKLAARLGFEAVLIEVDPPDMPAMALAEALWKRDAAVVPEPVIFLLAPPGKVGFDRSAFSARVAATVTLPFEGDDLARRLANAVVARRRLSNLAGGGPVGRPAEPSRPVPQAPAAGKPAAPRPAAPMPPAPPAVPAAPPAAEPAKSPARPAYALVDVAPSATPPEKRSYALVDAPAPAPPPAADEPEKLDLKQVLGDHASWLATGGREGRRAVLAGTDLSGADLKGANLANANLREADLSDADLAGARLSGADLRRAVLGAASANEVDFGVANLRHADLRLARLENASLRGTDLSGATLGGAVLTGADFAGATLVGTDIKDTDLSDAANLTATQVSKAQSDHTTRLPPGVFVERDWAEGNGTA